jgi:D-alanyl-D-alanine carboxypeptidase/D-alanyl-D-alanine-endopeptidase (penicillin-binding protein 4)
MRSRSLVAAVLLVGGLGLGPLAPCEAREGAPAGLGARIDRRLRAGRMAEGTYGACVVDLATGRTVYERNGDAPLVPASVAKVATAAAALDLLGPGWRYATTLSARGTLDPATGTLDGSLVLHGSGDPNLSKRGHEGETLYPLLGLARAAAAAGIRRTTGPLVLDDGPFDREVVHPGWSRSDLAAWYGAPVAGLVFNDACVTVRVRGADEEGEAARVEAPHTSGAWALVAAVVTSGARRPEVGGLFLSDPRRLRVTGELGARSEVEVDVPVPDPLAHVGGAMLEALARAGVAAPGFRAASGPDDRAPGRTVGVVEHDLAATLRVMNRRSQNLFASLVFKACGAAREGTGSWASGERAVGDVFARRGVATPGARVVDGSGLARENRLAAGPLARLLASVDGDVLRGPILRDSLAAPGDDGTLHARLGAPEARRRVRAKTGTLRGVHALAGYVDGRGVAPGFAFAVLLNRNPADGSATDLIDDVVREILDE